MAERTPGELPTPERRVDADRLSRLVDIPAYPAQSAACEEPRGDCPCDRPSVPSVPGVPDVPDAGGWDPSDKRAE